MKIAVFGDIHGNIEALKAAYDAAVAAEAERMFHLGDLGGYAPFVNEVVDFLIGRGIEGVQGNYDETVGNDREHCGCKYEDPLQAEMSARGFEWTKKHTSEQSKEYMRRLPCLISFTVHGRKVAIFHATPLKNNLYWYEDRPEKFFHEMAEKIDADVMIYGHTHKPYRKDIGGKIFINAGSVGKPKDGDPRACLTLVTVTPRMILTEFRRIPYAVEKVASTIIASRLPPYFAERLREGK
ncbi:MAG: metallophosphatase family protein [Alphaproteobacteria bacterium]|uniref:Phosphoesterase n=1 Tax=Candidatus Nitrobium versatile TaxID=2884831 RepID=A0A953M1N5_9BACT|nr:metallophosphatase family protein [Candidatus Nitrobium versatile]